MSLDIIPKRMLSFPNLSSILDDDDWVSISSVNNGLSVSEDEKCVYIEAAVPGIDPSLIDVTYQDGYIWVRGEQKDEEKDKNRKYYRQSARSFSYRVAVPADVDQHAEPEATYKHGMMMVKFEKSKKSQPRKIEVRQISSSE